VARTTEWSGREAVWDGMVLTTLETRRTRADLIEVYKIIHGMEGLRVEDFFEMLHVSNTRGHSYKIFKKSFRTDFGKYSFGNRVIEERNSLPAGVVLADSINKFKNLLDHHLKQVRGSGATRLKMLGGTNQIYK